MAMFGSRFQGGINFPQLEASGVAPMAAPVPAPATRPAAFGRGGMGWDILGGVSDGILALNGMAPVYGPSEERRRAQQAELAQEEARYQRERSDKTTDWQMQHDAEAAEPRYFQDPTGNYVMFDPATQSATTVYDAPDKPVPKTALEQQVALYRTLNPKATDAEVADIVRRGIAGAQYDPGVYRPMTDYKAAAARATKAMPTYAQSHPRPRAPRAAPKPPSGFILD